MTVITVSADDRRPLGERAGIPPRRMDFEFDPAQTQRYYFDNNPSKTAVVTALSALFPAGESFFVESVREYRHKISDPLLKAQVAGFIGQEAMHSKEHLAFNITATSHGYPVDTLDRSVTRLLAVVAKLPKPIRLAVTVCLEHYTAIFAEMLLRDAELQACFSPETRKLWLWHALEENEHKTVAFDVYQQEVGSYLLRTGVMIPTTLIFFGVLAVFYGRLIAADGRLFKLRETWDTLGYLFNLRSGKFTRLLPQYLDFFKLRFDPRQHDTDALLNEWRDKLFGEDGLLTEQLKKPGAKKAH